MVIAIIDKETKREYTIEARYGGENAIVCPKCSDDRRKKSAKSLSFNASKGLGNCHHCNSHFYAKENLSKQMEIPKKEYVRPVWRNLTALSDKVVRWFSDRGISQKTLVDFRVSEGEEWMPQVQSARNTIQFNYFVNSELVNIKFRDGQKNFKLVSGAELVFYNLDAISGKKEVVIVEGEIDCLSFYEIGIYNVVSVPNGASKGGRLEYLDNCWHYFEDVDKIYIATDNDEAGRALREELARRLGKERCAIVDYGPYKDANEWLVADRLGFENLLKVAKDYPIEGIMKMEDIAESLFDLKRNGLKPGDGISIREINEHITYERGFVTVVTGVPNHGKGEFLDQVVVDLTFLHDWRFGIYSPENGTHAMHTQKLFSKVCAEDFNEASMNTLQDFISACNDSFFMISPPDDLSLDSILDYARVLVKKYGINGLVIDPWNKLDHQWKDSERAHISRSLDKLDNFARKYNVHIFVVAHPTKLNKDKETKKVEVPSLYSISGTADWFNKVANGIVVYRNWYDGGDSDTDIHIQKVKFKHWGKQGVVNLSYDYKTGRYYKKGLSIGESYLKPKQTEIKHDPKPNTQFLSRYEPKSYEDDDDGQITTAGREAPF
jgi:twinkle protein